MTAAVAVGLTLTACTDAAEDNQENTASAPGAEDQAHTLETNGPEAIADADGSGVEVSTRFFEEADALVVADRDYDNQLAAAQAAVERSAPMVLFTGDNGEDVAAEAERLGAGEILAYGETAGLEVPGVEITPGEAAEEEAEGSDAAASTHAEVVEQIAALEATGADHPVSLPPILVTDASSPASVATAKAAGGEVHLLSHPDPRITSESMELVQNGDTIALGAQFGSSEDYAERVDLAANGELPGGGGLVFPGRRMIAFYGHPSGSALGVMGEQPPVEAVDRVAAHVENYQPLDEQPIIPAFEIIVTVASEYPGEDGNYSNEFPQEDYVGYIDEITDAGGYAVLDLQPGRATFLEQAKLYEDLLKRPNVGLAVDPEWNIGPEEMPMQRIGHAEAWEINETAEWLANLVQENDLPQKMFIVHQFQHQMVRDRDQLDTSHPELAFVLHADGNGTPEMKFETWNALREGLSDDWFMAWKNFIDEDTPTFTPEQTYNEVDPRPWFVSYQ